MINESERTLNELAYARKAFENAKRFAPNFGYALCNSLLGISSVVEAIPVSLISSMDFETYWNLNLDFARLKENLSKKGLEKEAMLAEKISTDFIHRYTTSHPL